MADGFVHRGQHACIGAADSFEIRVWRSVAFWNLMGCVNCIEGQAEEKRLVRILLLGICFFTWLGEHTGERVWEGEMGAAGEKGRFLVKSETLKI